ncbi:MAG TPA: ROK family protein [bacterium]|nr:ROK family protein [bacterium]
MYLIVDITTNFTTLTLFKSFDKKSQIKTTKYPTVLNYDLALKKLSKKLETLIPKKQKVKATAISVVGIVDYKNNLLEYSAYLDKYTRKDLPKFLKDILDCPATMIQDSSADGLAELDNLAKGVDNYSLITVTYGIGGVHIERTKDEVIVFPTELGHIIVVPNGRQCPCGQRGCVEAYIGGESLKDRFLKSVSEIDDMRIWEEAVEYLAIATVNLLMSFPSDTMIYSGDSISTVPYLRRKIRDEVDKRLTLTKMPNVKISRLGRKANTSGALKMLELKEDDIKLTIMN